MSETTMQEQLQQMESKLQRMRLAIIVIAAFLIYEALGPLPFGRERVDIQQEIKVRELFVVDERGQTVGYLGGDGDGGGLFLDDAAGNRLDARAAELRLLTVQGEQRAVRLRLEAGGVGVYDAAGRVEGMLP